jgi:hypothetical protein
MDTADNIFFIFPEFRELRELNNIIRYRFHNSSGLINFYFRQTVYTSAEVLKT